MNNSKQYALDHGLSWAVVNNETQRVKKFLSKGANALAPCYADSGPIDRAPNIISYAIKDSDPRMFRMLFRSLEIVDCDTLFKYAVEHIPHSLYIRALPKRNKVQAYDKLYKADTLHNYKRLAFKHLGICSYILLKSQNLTKNDIEYPDGKPPPLLNTNPDGTIGDADADVERSGGLTTTTHSPSSLVEDDKSKSNEGDKSKSNGNDSESESDSKSVSSDTMPIGSDIEGEIYKEIVERVSKKFKPHVIRNTTVIENDPHMYTYMKLSAILGHVLCFKILPSGGYHNHDWNQKILEYAIIRSRTRVIQYLVVDMQLLANITNYKRILKLALRLKSNDVLNLCLENRKD
jgi:hypothetical protein